MLTILLSLFFNYISLSLEECASQRSCQDCISSGDSENIPCQFCTYYIPALYNSTQGPFCYSHAECLVSPLGCGSCLFDFQNWCPPPELTMAEIVGISLGISFILCIVFTLRVMIPYWCGGNMRSEPLVDQPYEKDFKIFWCCCGYNEYVGVILIRSYWCCLCLRSVHVEDDGREYRLSSDRISFLIILICAFIFLIIPLLTLALNPAVVSYSWVTVLLIPVAMLPQVFLSWRYVTVFDRSSRNVRHTLYVGPFQLIPIESVFDFSDIVDIQVFDINGYYSRMKLILSNDEEKIILIDGDTSTVKGTYWRIKREILEMINKPLGR